MTRDDDQAPASEQGLEPGGWEHSGQPASVH